MKITIEHESFTGTADNLKTAFRGIVIYQYSRFKRQNRINHNTGERIMKIALLIIFIGIALTWLFAAHEI